MIISKLITEDRLLEVIYRGEDVMAFVENSIRPQDKGIKFIVDNQYYYCAILIHNTKTLPWNTRKRYVERLVDGHCAFGSIYEFTTLQDIVQYANKRELVRMLQKGTTL